ncbi:uncharacterized protein LOC113294447 [Papaver somniferum]|uniref:uncharacterized protein LOC113294447 n=1 Tax=Papaver somniferum TaxID=3469 RepID=UPI000E6FDB09|nr:uncharacterized protein LOC113294447 [Papaver somniferum]
MHAERLKLVMSGLISNAQGAFVKEKHILNGILISNELTDSRLRQKISGIMCKIDMQKAFDNVSCPSLFTVLAKNGFGDKRIQWMRWHVTGTQFSILVNGEATNMIKPSKGEKWNFN